MKVIGKSSESNWINGLDSLRMVLAMTVFLSHLENQPAAFFKSFDVPLLKVIGIAVNHLFLGPGAVIAFFIISGFVIHYPFRSRKPEVASFLVRRWLRIGIPLLVVVAISLYFNMFTLIPIWSLYCELIYYTLYPLLRKSGLNWRLMFIISFVLSMMIIAFNAKDELRSMVASANINYTGSYAVAGDWYTWLIGLPCWLLGVIIAEEIDSIKRSVSLMKINIIRLVVLGMAMIIVGLKAHFFVSYVVTLNFYAFVLAYWLREEIIFFRDHRSWHWLEYGGKFSYSLYLLHAIIITLIAGMLDLNVVTYFIYIILSLILAYVFFKIVEEPSHRFSKYISRLVK